LSAAVFACQGVSEFADISHQRVLSRIQVMERMDPNRTTGWFVMAKHRRMVRGAASSCRCHCGLLPMQYRCCRAAAAAARRALILWWPGKGAPGRVAEQYEIPRQHSTRCRDLTRSSQAALAPPLIPAAERRTLTVVVAVALVL
jgi:hypothetical protein